MSLIFIVKYEMIEVSLKVKKNKKFLWDPVHVLNM